MSAAGRCGPFAGAAGAAAASVGVSVLVGWWSGVGVLKSLFPGLVAMNPVTAVCFVLTGLALRRLAAPEPRTGLARACAGAVVVLACLRLAGCLFGWDLGVDRLLFTAALDAGPSGIPNRMAPNTAANFLLLGSALLLLGARFRRDLWAQALAVLVAGVSFLALLGYAYGAKQLYRLALFMPMAVNTAVTFFVTAAGVVCATAEVGVMPLLTGDSAAGHAARRLLPMSVVVPTLCGWLTLRGAAAGLFSTEFGTSLLVTAIIVVFLTVIYWNAETLHGMELAKDEANAALKHAHDDLEVRVQDRTADLRREMGEKSRLQSQLVQSQKMEAVGRLAGGVAHDFNNILTAIGGYCGFLLDGLRPGDPRHDDLDEIRKAGDRAAALTRQLLAFSRRQVLASQVLDLNALIADMERMLGRIIGEDVELKTALAPSLGRIQGDQGQVEQVLLNLVINAKDAMPKGGLIIVETADVELDEDYARMHLQVKAGSYVMMSVADTGTGMDETTLSHLFEPFFTTKELGKGTGLGAGHGLRHRQAERRGGLRLQRAGPRLGLQGLFPARGGPRGRGRSARPCRPRGRRFGDGPARRRRHGGAQVHLPRAGGAGLQGPGRRRSGRGGGVEPGA